MCIPDFVVYTGTFTRQICEKKLARLDLFHYFRGYHTFVFNFVRSTCTNSELLKTVLDGIIQVF